MKERPIGVSILAVLHLVGGVGLVAMQVWMLFDYERIAAGMSEVGIPPTLLFIGVLLLAVLGLASGIGMWIGTKWGWWCATFYYTYGLTRNFNALYFTWSISDEIPAGPRGASYYYAKYTARFCVSLLLLLYFFKPNVLAYFDMQGVHRGKAIAALATATAAIFGVASVVSLATQ
jgi:hypothetical protein